MLRSQIGVDKRIPMNNVFCLSYAVRVHQYRDRLQNLLILHLSCASFLLLLIMRW